MKIFVVQHGKSFPIVEHNVSNIDNVLDQKIIYDKPDQQEYVGAKKSICFLTKQQARIYQLIEELAEALLDDDRGIGTQAWNILKELPGVRYDMIGRVKIARNRAYVNNENK